MYSQNLRRAAAVTGACLWLLLAACATTGASRGATTSAQDRSGETATPAARSVILFIGDGMGVSTVTATRILDGQRKGMQGEENVLPFERFPYLALSKTYEVNQQVAESAGTATAILSGSKTQAGFIGVNRDAVRKNCASAGGNRLQTVLELAEAGGRSTGVVTTTRLTHATPAASYAHVPERNWESDRDLSDEAVQNGCADIAAQLIGFPYGDGMEVALGGGRIKFLPYDIADPEGANTTAGRLDGRDLTLEWLQKYPRSAYVWNQEQFDAIDPGATDHLLGLFASDHMQFEADRAGDTAGEPSLAEMTRLAIEILRRNPKGYFLLVEGGRIDHAHHDNNAYRALTDGIAFADAVAVADGMTSQDDTLIIVTADHSHTFTMAGYPTRGNPILGKAVYNDSTGKPADSPKLMNDQKPFTTLGYYTGPGAAWVGGPRPDLSDTDTAGDRDFVQQGAIPAEDDTHGGEDVPVYARGPGAENVHGVIEQNEIFRVIDKALRLTPDTVH